VRKDVHIDGPRAETSTHWIFMGFDEDLNEAMKVAVARNCEFPGGTEDSALAA